MHRDVDVDDADDCAYFEIAPHGPPSMCPPGREQPPPHRQRWNARYLCPREINYWSPRYKVWITVARFYPSDGATRARDVDSRAWWVHDLLCDWASSNDGTPFTVHMASAVIYDMLREDGLWFRARTWYLATLLGGGDCRKNGIWRKVASGESESVS